MRLAKRRLAALMAALMMIPAQPAMAAQLPPSEIVEMTEETAVRQMEEMDLASEEDKDSKEKNSSNEEESEDEELNEDSSKEEELEDQKQNEDISREEESEDQKQNEDVSREEESEDQKLNGDSLRKEESEVPGLEEDSPSEEERKEEVSEKETLNQDELEDDFSNKEESEDERLKEVSSKKESEFNSKASQKEDISDEEILDEDLIFEEVEEENLQKVKKVLLATPSDAKERPATPKEEICFNTGNHMFHIVSREDFFENELGDAWCEEEGSYTIQIPEQNPFFPYEVQFTYEGKVKTEWFMDPDDSVKVGNHTFYVSSSFDGTAVTQMSLKVGGDTVVVYPEKKKFTDDELAGIDVFSLMPLEKRELPEIDLSMYTPAELTMVSLDQIFIGDEKLDSMDKVVWTCEGDDYKISQSGDRLDLSYGTSRSSEVYWEMIMMEIGRMFLCQIMTGIVVMRMIVIIMIRTESSGLMYCQMS